MTNELSSMTKEQLIKLVQQLKDELHSLKTSSSNLKYDRKKQVLEIIQKGPQTISEISKIIGISNANVSSQLSYLRKDGYKIFTDDEGRKFIPSNK
jgi:biotin operon repressor